MFSADRRVVRTIALGGDVAFARVDRELDANARAVIEIADHEIRIEDVDVGERLDLACLHFARAFGLEHEALRTVGVELQRQLFDVQHDVGDVFAHARNGREFVQHAVDLNRGDRGALQRLKQNAAQRVAERQTEAALERLGNDHGMRARSRAGIDLQLHRLNQFLPILLDHVGILRGEDAFKYR